MVVWLKESLVEVEIDFFRCGEILFLEEFVCLSNVLEKNKLV